MDETAACGECFARVAPDDMPLHMEWHTWVAPFRRAGPILDERRRRGEAE